VVHSQQQNLSSGKRPKIFHLLCHAEKSNSGGSEDRTPLKKASAADFVAGFITLFTATLATLEAAPFKAVGACENTLDTTAPRTDGGVCTKAVTAYAALMLQSFSNK
jgi:hypothetical protein